MPADLNEPYTRPPPTALLALAEHLRRFPQDMGLRIEGFCITTGELRDMVLHAAANRTDEMRVALSLIADSTDEPATKAAAMGALQ